MIAPIPQNEPDRLLALEAFGLLDTPPEPEYDDLTHLAATICDAPIALVSLVDSCRQWFKSKHGIDACETHRDTAFCSHAIHQPTLFEIPDATLDPRFWDNPLVQGEPHIRFYAGMPLATPGGYNVGTLCVIDREPRQLSETQRNALRVLARQVMAQMTLRLKCVELQRTMDERERTEHALIECEQRFRYVVEELAEGLVLLDRQSRKVLSANRAFCELLGYFSEELLELTQYDFVAHDKADIDAKMLEIERIGRLSLGFRKYRRNDGSLIDVTVSGSYLIHNSIPVLCLVVQDMTQIKKAENNLWESEQRFRAFIDNSPVVAFLKDESGKYTFVNRPLEKRFGKPAETWLNHSDEELFPNEFSAVWRANDRKVLSGTDVVEFEETVPLDDGNLSYWTTYKFPFEDATGKRYLAGLGLDVTEKKAFENVLRASEQKFRSVVDRLAEGVFVIQAKTGRMIEANSAFLQMVGYSLDELHEKGLFQIVQGESKEIFEQNVKAIHKQLASEGKCDLGRKWFRRKDGGIIPVELRVTVVANGENELHVVIVRDISEQVENENRLYEYQLNLETANSKLKELSITDGLTKVFNRAAFNERLTEEWDRATRYSHPLSLLLMDVDYFKLFNDTYGHPAGDEVLKSVANILRFSVRSTDMVARYGGEEFAIVLPDTDLSGALVMAERCRRAIAGATWDKRPITVSIGVSTQTKNIADPAALIHDADLGLYRSKQGGRNRVSQSRESTVITSSEIEVKEGVLVAG